MTDLLAGSDDIVIDPNKKYFDELVGEGKKYKDQEELAKSYWHADRTIDIFKRQKDELRADYLKEKEQNVTRAQLEELIDRMSTKQIASEEITMNNGTPPAFDPKQIESLVSSKISEHETLRAQEANFNTVKGKLVERFGSNYQDALNKQRTDLGLSQDEMNEMARRHPQVFIKTFGLDQKPRPEGFQPPMQSNLAFAPTGGNKRTWNFYQEMRKNNPTVYHNQKTQEQMMTDYNQLGKDFEDGNFHQLN